MNDVGRMDKFLFMISWMNGGFEQDVMQTLGLCLSV